MAKVVRKVDPSDEACKKCEHRKQGDKCYLEYCNYEPVC